MQLNCEIVANLELDGNCFYYENFNFFFLLKLIIHVGGEWKGGWLNYWQVCWKGQGLERIDGQSGTYVSHCSML